MRNENHREGQSISRTFVVAASVALVGVVWTHGLAQLTRQFGSPEAPLEAGALTFAAFALAVAVTLLATRKKLLAGFVAGAACAVGVIIMAPGAWAASLALPISGALLLAVARKLYDALPVELDLIAGRRRLLSVVWLLVALASVAQMGRLATWTTDPSYDFVVATRNPFWYRHLCLPAYLYGAELADRGEVNLYDARHYPGTHPDAAPDTKISGMSVEDPYQYPPQFLLLPWVAMQLSKDFNTLRILWFAIQFTLFVGVFVALARWIGGQPGKIALWSLPAVLVTFPMTFNFQFGQFHLPAIALAIAGMIALSKRRIAIGSLMVAWAILAKLFPLILIPVLAVNRKYREIGWILGWTVVITLATFLILGPAPFTAFIDYHLPRLSNGEAFAFGEIWPELADLVIADNQGPYGLALKLGLSGQAAAWVGRSFTLLLAGLAIVAAVRFRKASRWGRSLLWMSLLGLGSLASPGAWDDYVTTAAVWTIALLAILAFRDPRWIAPLLATVLFEGFLLGTIPIEGWDQGTLLSLSAIGSLLLLLLYVVILQSRPEKFAQSSRVEDVERP
jgi:hypothetical protein